MKKLLLFTLLISSFLGISGCTEEKSTLKIEKPTKVLNQEVLPGKTPINAAQNVRDLINKSTKDLEGLLNK